MDIQKKIIPALAAAAVIATSLTVDAAVSVVGVNTNTDAAYGTFVSSTDLINQGRSTFSSVAYSNDPTFGGLAATGGANNDGSIGTANTTSTITYWGSLGAGSVRSITYTLNTAVNTLGYDINSIQTINGWTNNSGNQKNQNYQVYFSMVGDAGFTGTAIQGTGGTLAATVAYLPFDPTATTAVTGSTKVNITEDATNLLASGVDQIRFIYTVPNPSGGGNPGATIREIDVFGVATAVPEPGSSILCCLGFMALLIRRRRK